jgi:hypothetical protein
MDYDLWLRLGAMSEPILVKRALACFCVHGGSRSTMQAASACAEELRVRIRFLESRGMWQFPFRLEYQVRKHLNRIFIKGLIASATGTDRDGEGGC